MAKAKDVLAWIAGQVEVKKNRNCIGTSRTYRVTMQSWRNFIAQNHQEEAELDDELMMRYESWLQKKGVCRNSCSFYLRVLRVCCRKSGMDVSKIFSEVYTGVDRTKKRALKLNELRRLKSMALETEKEQLARDMFLLSFYLRGISFVDLAHLRWSDLRKEELVYRRRKTNQTIRIRWEECMHRIVKRWHKADSDYLLPLLETQSYDSALRTMNRSLNMLGRRLNLPHPLTTYVARHTWASLAYQNQIPISIISEGLGHDSIRTTQIYLESLERGQVDEANSKVIGLLE